MKIKGFEWSMKYERLWLDNVANKASVVSYELGFCSVVNFVSCELFTGQTQSVYLNTYTLIDNQQTVSSVNRGSLSSQ